MTTVAKESAGDRIPLSRDRILRTAVGLADEHGLPSLTMRRIADELGVEAMSLYHHVASKEALLDGAVDLVMAEIEADLGGMGVPTGALDWKPALRRRILTARRAMLRHPWAPQILETRTSISPAIMRYFDGTLGILLAGGFTYDLGHHAMHALGSRALGFAQELFVPGDGGDDDAGVSMTDMADEVPHLVAMLTEIVPHTDGGESLGWCDDQEEFEFGLDLLLDGLERRLGDVSDVGD